MAAKDLNRPFPVYVPPHGRTATVEVIFSVDPQRSLPPGDLEELLEEISRRVNKALSGIFEKLPAKVEIEDIGIGNSQHTPFFPATFGEEVFEDQIDVYDAIDKLRKDTSLAGILYDISGRAFSVHVWTSFRREPEEDKKIAELWTLDPQWD